MKNSWRQLYRRLAAGCVISGSMAWSSAMCYAVQLAYDDASDPVYSDGWQAGDDGGSGILGAWNFSGTYNSTVQQAMDNGLKAGNTGSSQFNDIGRAWTLFNPNAPNFRDPGTPAGPDNPPSNDTDITQPGRPITGGLPVNSTVKVIIDNPAERAYYRGWAVKLNHGGASGCWNGDNCSTIAYDPGTITTRSAIVGTFENFSYGEVYTSWTGPTGFDVEDTDAGLMIEFTLTGTDTFNITLTPLDNPGSAFTGSGTMNDGLGKTIDWIEFEFYNTDSDFYPSIVTGPPPPGDYNSNGRVDAADYVLWRDGGPLQNEVADPGAVSAADYTEWRARFGNSTVGDPRSTDFYIRSIEITTPSGSGAGVPEPGAFVLLVAGACGLVLRGARRRQ